MRAVAPHARIRHVAGMFTYRHSGLFVASQIELPEWAAFAREADGEADVRISVTPDAPFPDIGDRLLVEDERVRFAVEEVGGWTIEAGQSITLTPRQGADAQELRLFTLGSAWGMLGYQRGHAMWHGSAARLGGRTALFCGDAGEGKSTMGAAMVDAGALLVADDLSRVEPQASGPLLYPSSQRLKLWGEAVDHFGWRESVLHRDWRREDKFHCSVPTNPDLASACALDLIVVLETGESHRIEPLRGAEAVAAVLKGTIYRPEALGEMGRWNEQAVLAARIVAGCHVVRLTRPRDLDALDRSMSLVSDCLGSLG